MGAEVIKLELGPLAIAFAPTGSSTLAPEFKNSSLSTYYLSSTSSLMRMGWRHAD